MMAHFHARNVQGATAIATKRQEPKRLNNFGGVHRRQCDSQGCQGARSPEPGGTAPKLHNYGNQPI